MRMLFISNGVFPAGFESPHTCQYIFAPQYLSTKIVYHIDYLKVAFIDGYKI